jgi:peptidoglycan hydrolase CwlO-like protein
MKMSTLQELEKLRAMRAELESESLSLKEQQSELEQSVISLEEKVAIEELKNEKDAIDELKNRNKVAKDAIAELKSKKKKLETKLGKAAQKQEAPVQPEETEVAGPVEIIPEEDGGVVVTALDGELLEDQETVNESPKRQEKRKRRFF